MSNRPEILCYNLGVKFKSILSKEIELTLERKQHILLYHPDLKPYLKFIKDVLMQPDDIRKSKSDQHVLLFYKFFANIKDGIYIMVAVKTNGRWFVLTSYLTRHMISGGSYAKE